MALVANYAAVFSSLAIDWMVIALALPARFFKIHWTVLRGMSSLTAFLTDQDRAVFDVMWALTIDADK